MTDIKKTIEKYDKNYDQYLETFKEIKKDIIKWNTAITKKNKKDIPTEEKFTSAIKEIANILNNIDKMYTNYFIHLKNYNDHHKILYKKNETMAQKAAKDLGLIVPYGSNAYPVIATLKQNLQDDQLQILENIIDENDTTDQFMKNYFKYLNINYSDKFKNSLQKLEFFDTPNKTGKDYSKEQLKKIIEVIVEIINKNIKPFNDQVEKFKEFSSDLEIFGSSNFIERYKTLKGKIELGYNQLTSEINSIQAYFENNPPEPKEEASSATTAKSGEEKKSSETIVELSLEPEEEASSETTAKLPSKEQKRERSIWDWVLLIFLVIVVAIGLITIIGIFIAFIYAVLDERRRYKKTGEWALGRVVLNSLFNWYYIYKYWMTYGII